MYIISFNIDVQNYSERLGSLKIRKKRQKYFYEISKCAINMCVVVLPFRRKFFRYENMVTVTIDEQYNIILLFN